MKGITAPRVQDCVCGGGGGQLLTDEPKTCLPFSPAARAHLPWAAGLGSQLGQKMLANFPVKAFSVSLSV